MIIKKYQAKTEQDAISLAKKELGPNIVILNVKNAKKKGFLCFLRPTLIEVTVALEGEQDRSRNNNIVKQSQVQTEISVDGTDSNISQSNSDGVISNAERNTIIDVQNISISDNKNKVPETIEDRLDSLQALLKEKLHIEGTDSGKSDDNCEDKDSNETLVLLQLIYSTLIDNEVDEKYVNMIVEELDKKSSNNTTMEVMLGNIYQKLILKLGSAQTISMEGTTPKVIFFVGPTGVGKTTTIAKIASRLKLNDGKSVGLLTTDTYRIAAAEQLKTYAGILGIAFKVIYTPEDMVDVIEEYSKLEYILVDTAGHSHKNLEQVDILKSFVDSIREDVDKEIFLVLSATTKKRDLLEIADDYKRIANYKIIFTKLDETSLYGNILNVRMHTGFPLSYVTCGQNVPEDIEIFNPQATVKSLLGGK